MCIDVVKGLFFVISPELLFHDIVSCDACEYLYVLIRDFQ